jgi:hypothetical protein
VGLASFAIILVVLIDAFETILLPRRVSRSIRFARVYYQMSWGFWRRLVSLFRQPKRRYNLLSVYAPLSLPVLFGLWATTLMVGFAGMHLALGSRMNGLTEASGLGDYFYFSGVTFLTLGYGDVSPADPLARALSVLEAGIGFGFLAIVIGYVPVIYQAFSRREIAISLLDARAGSPPTAGELLTRIGEVPDQAEVLVGYFEEWEVWAAELLESHLSFPILAFFRSQHDNQSWLSALTMILDTTAIVLAGLPSFCPYQGRLTFAVARHAAVDLAQTFLRRPRLDSPDRLDPAHLERLIQGLRSSGVQIADEAEFARKLADLRQTYEPFLEALSEYCLLDLPPFIADKTPVDNWQTSAWMRRTQRLGELAGDDHDD